MLVRNSQRSHYDCPVWLQQVLVLPVWCHRAQGTHFRGVTHFPCASTSPLLNKLHKEH